MLPQGAMMTEPRRIKPPAYGHYVVLDGKFLAWVAAVVLLSAGLLVFGFRILMEVM
jgi:hypothetical protein